MTSATLGSVQGDVLDHPTPAVQVSRLPLLVQRAFGAGPRRPHYHASLSLHQVVGTMRLLYSACQVDAQGDNFTLRGR